MSDTIKKSIRRIPWKQFIKKQAVKVLFLIFIGLMIIFSIIFSYTIDIETFDYYNPTIENMLLITVSSISFLALLFGVLKTFVFDNAVSFGLKDLLGNYNWYRTSMFSFLTVSFIGSVYQLLDVALQDALLELGPVMLIRVLIDSLNLSIPGFTDLTGKEFYQTARNVIFAGFLIFIILYVILAMLVVLTRIGRKRISSKFEKVEDEEDIKKETHTFYKVLAFIAIPPLSFILISTFGQAQSSFSAFIILVVALLFVWWIYQLLKFFFRVIWRGVKITTFVTSTNILLLVPIILVFWFLPALLATFYHMVTDSIQFTTINEVILLNLQYLGSLEDIILFDFVILAGVATVVIGFTEGISLLALVSVMKQGVTIARSGRIAIEQAPKIVVWTKYFFIIGIWFGIFINNLSFIWEPLVEWFSLPDFPFPNLLTLITQISYMINDFINIQLPNFSDLLLPIVLMIIPLYFIVSASFKFLSITLITPRIKDLDYFIVLVSTAFVLILFQILSDLWSIPEIQDAPLRVLQDSGFFATAMQIIHLLEAVSFYIGFLVGITFFLRKIPWTRFMITETPDEAIIGSDADLITSAISQIE